MAAALRVLDGTQAYGTPVITTVTAAVAYQLNNISISRPVTEAKDYDENGMPGRARYTGDVAELTAECQLATSSTTPPVFGDTFTLTVDAAYGSETWIIMPSDYSATNGAGDIRVVPLRARKSINGAPTLVTS